MKKEISVNGCGRTDAQVHASQYIFHSDIPDPLDFDLKERLNHNLPPDICIFDIFPVHDRAHARFDATERTYDYFIHTEKSPFLYDSSAFYSGPALDFNRMQTVVNLLPQYDDYYAFCKSPASFEHTICRVSSARLWVDEQGGRLRFQITANRFLTGMIRIITWRLLQVGAGLMSPEEFENYLIARKGPRIVHSAYPQGLYLSRIVYPYLAPAPRPELTGLLGYDTAGYWKEI